MMIEVTSVQIPREITLEYPIKKVIEAIQKEFKDWSGNYANRKIIVRKSECESNYERIEICIPHGPFNISVNVSLEKIFKKTDFYIAHIYRFKEKSAFKILLCRKASYSRKAK